MRCAKAAHPQIRKLMLPVIDEFKSLFEGKNLSEVTQFKNFKHNLDKIFGTDTQTLDQKMRGIL